jgi:plasmid stabilization system protein ParE
MVREVVWTKQFQRQVDKTFDYISENLTVQGAIHFVQNIYAQEVKLSKHPETGRLSDTSDRIRYILIDNHRRIYYCIYPNRVIVLALFDTRQDPKKRPY